MKKIIKLFLIILFFLMPLNVDAYVSVEGYYRKDGTYVRPHVRSDPNGLKYDNYSYNSNQGLYNDTYGTRGSDWDTPSYITDPDYYQGKNLYDNKSYTPSLPSYNSPSYSTPSCPSNSYYNSTSDTCKCNYGYVVKEGITGQSCVSGSSYCRDKYGLFSSYDSISKNCKCSSGYILDTNFLGDLACVNADSYCSDKHGLHSNYDTLSKICECDYGYELSNSQCIKKETSSYNYSSPDYYSLLNKYSSNQKDLSCPINSTEGSDGKCYCDDSYKLNDKQNGCIKVLCSTNAKVVSSGCVCNKGYVMRNDKCISYTEDCKQYHNDNNMYGYKGEEKGTSGCNCVSGYKWDGVNSKCIIVVKVNKNITDKTTNIEEYIKKEKEEVKKIDKNLSNRMNGRILLQVEDHGEAWYVEPKTSKRHYMANGGEAYNIMRNLGVGITNKDLEKVKTNKTFARQHNGKIFLQVEAHGEAYYIDVDGNAHYLKDGGEAYTIMRELGLGITNNDLRKIDIN